MANERSTEEIALDLAKLVVEVSKGMASRPTTAKEILDIYGQCLKRVVTETNPD